ncbi:BspA family leucine-rich repeat surface protein [Mycoplasmopsis agalactiae]|uniref:BspA family leucine-rich repeat surface protein n=1 Tax=Mycoplasmopsis agalactiae TaxID=2110 RepID=UPI001F8C6DC4|nr:BspA family leucine-rich repeat surface protein [Mycoplasmopsis agalactiae]MCE6057369.1 BspA family leucine-rich repeat surface protein [Mycoplasmopsis agalactiae]
MTRLKKLMLMFSSVVTLSTLPIVAAKCGDTDSNAKTDDPSKKIDDPNNNKESGDQKNPNKNPNNTENPDHNNTAGKTDNGSKDDKNNMTPSDDLNALNKDTDEEEKRKQEAEKKKKEEEEAKRKQEEERKKLKEAEDKKNVVEIQKIVEEQKDAFGSFHSQKDFVDQINVYAKDKKISGLTLQNEEDGNKSLAVDTDGGKKNKIKLQLGSQKFEVNLGIVLKDAVITKFYYEDNHQQGQVMNNLLKANGDSIINKTWTNYKNGKNIVIKQLGYHRDHTGIKLTVVPHYTSKVPKHLPLKISSINLSFYNLESLKIDNINEWDLSNVQNAGQAFLNAKHFSQDLSQWKLKSGANTQKIFEKANKMNEHLDKIAKTWNVEVSKLK